MGVRLTCVCGKTYWSPGADWQHLDCKAMHGAEDLADTKGGATTKLITSPVDPKRVVEVAEGAPKKKFDRTAYQREYMKAWRAKK